MGAIRKGNFEGMENSTVGERDGKNLDVEVGHSSE